MNFNSVGEFVRSTQRKPRWLRVLVALCCLFSISTSVLAYLQYLSFDSRRQTLLLQNELDIPVDEIFTALVSSDFAKDVEIIYSNKTYSHHSAVFAFSAPHTWHKYEYDQSRLLKRWAEAKGWTRSFEEGSSAGTKRLKLSKGSANVVCLVTIYQDISWPANPYKLDPNYMAYVNGQDSQQVLGPELGDRVSFRLFIQLLGGTTTD